MRIATGKSTLKRILQVEVSQRLLKDQLHLWMMSHWFIGQFTDLFLELFEAFVPSFKELLTKQLDVSAVYLCFHRYFEFSIKGGTGVAGALATSVHQLDLKTPLPGRDSTLKHSANKSQLSSLIREQLLGYRVFLQRATHAHKVVVTGDDSTPTQISKGCEMPRLDLQTTHDEADIIIAQQATSLAEQDRDLRVYVVSDDIDVFALSSAWISVFTDS